MLPFLFTLMYFTFQVGAFSVLKELVVVLPDCLADHIGSLVPGIEKALNVSSL
jgi:cullin-associated NEDD8-dissociated protein 1